MGNNMVYDSVFGYTAENSSMSAEKRFFKTF